MLLKRRHDKVDFMLGVLRLFYPLEYVKNFLIFIPISQRMITPIRCEMCASESYRRLAYT